MGKLVFLKLYSPYCPHCKSMAKAWNELAAHFEDVDDILIGSVDCTDSPKGKLLCGRFKVMGLPTLLYGDGNYPMLLQEYAGDKTFEQLKSFAVKELVPKCSPGREVCSESNKELIERFMSWTYQELDDTIKAVEKEETDIQDQFSANYKSTQR